LVSNQPDVQDPLQAAWTHLGLGERQVLLRCQHYFAACQVVADSDALLTMPRTYADQLASVLPVICRDLPVPVPPLSIWMYWHADREGDPAHQWLRSVVLARSLDAWHGLDEPGQPRKK
jgi:DNA-binding transcriptional LysR family regulator